MAISNLDTRGLRCPQPTLKLMTAMVNMKHGDIVEIVADCPTFDIDLKGFCERTRKVLLFIRDEGNNVKRAQVKV